MPCRQRIERALSTPRAFLFWRNCAFGSPSARRSDDRADTGDRSLGFTRAGVGLAKDVVLEGQNAVIVVAPPHSIAPVAMIERSAASMAWMWQDPQASRATR